MSVEEILRRYRIDNNLTQQKMAKLLGVSQVAYHKWESNYTKIPLGRYLIISMVCDVKLQDILPENWQEKISADQK